MDDNKEKIIYLTPTRYNILDGDYELKEIRIRDFLKRINNDLLNRKSMVEKDDEKFIVTMDEKKYGLKIEDIDFSLNKKLNKMHEKYKKIKYIDEYEDNRPSIFIEEEIKNLNTIFIKNILIEFLSLLRVLVVPASITVIVFGLIEHNLVTALLPVLPFVAGMADFLSGIIGESGLFSNVPKTIHKIEDNLNELKVRKKELERRDIIHKIKELNKENDNSLNYDTKKEEMKKELLSNLRKLMSIKRYEEIVEQISRKKKEEITLRENEYSIDSGKEIEPYEQVNNLQYAYPSGGKNTILRKVLRR